MEFHNFQKFENYVQRLTTPEDFEANRSILKLVHISEYAAYCDMLVEGHSIAVALEEGLRRGLEKATGDNNIYRDMDREGGVNTGTWAENKDVDMGWCDGKH